VFIILTTPRFKKKKNPKVDGKKRGRKRGRNQTKLRRLGAPTERQYAGKKEEHKQRKWGFSSKVQVRKIKSEKGDQKEKSDRGMKNLWFQRGKKKNRKVSEKKASAQKEEKD